MSTDLLHDGYVPLVHFRIITAEVMEVLHEYLLFASWEEYFHVCIRWMYCRRINEYWLHYFHEHDTSIRLNGFTI